MPTSLGSSSESLHQGLQPNAFTYWSVFEPARVIAYSPMISACRCSSGIQPVVFTYGRLLDWALQLPDQVQLQGASAHGLHLHNSVRCILPNVITYSPMMVHAEVWDAKERLAAL